MAIVTQEIFIPKNSLPPAHQIATFVAVAAAMLDPDAGTLDKLGLVQDGRETVVEVGAEIKITIAYQTLPQWDLSFPTPEAKVSALKGIWNLALELGAACRKPSSETITL